MYKISPVRPLWILFAVAISFLPAYSAQAQKTLTPVNFKGRYALTLGLVRFGEARLQAREDAGGYRADAEIDGGKGLAHLLNPHQSHTTVTGTPERVEYETRYSTRKKKKRVKMAYENGTLAELTLEPPENRAQRAEVPPEMSHGSYDPLTYFLKVREALAATGGVSGKRFSLKVFDGRRLTETTYAVAGRTYYKFKGKLMPVIEARARRKPLAGFTEKELREITPKEPELIVYFTDDAQLMPLRLEIRMWFGTLGATLVEEEPAEQK